MEVRIFQAEDVKSIKEQKKRFLPGIKRSAILLECRLRGGRNLARHAWIRPCSVLQDRLQNWRDKPVDSPVDRPLEPSHGDETSVQFSTVQSLSRVWLFAIPWTAAHQASLSITNSQSSLKLTSIKLVMPSYHLILCRPLLLLPSVFPSISVFSKESVLCIR